jgi:UvrD-like helicase family protein/nuclease-like protein
VAAGGSAARQSRQLQDDAEGLFELARLKREQARNFAAACSSEEQLATILRPLDALGWTVLEDRCWPRSRRANVDFILVGPGGVVVVDAKRWAELEIRDGSLYRGDSCEDEEVAKLSALIDSLSDGIAHTGLTCTSISAAMVFTDRRLNLGLGPVTALGDRDVVPWLAGLRHRLSPEQVVAVVDAVAACCPEMPHTEPVRRMPRPALKPLPVPRAVELAPLVDEPLIDVDALAQVLLDTALAGPIEDWMTFLHPEQNRLVRTQWSGPARLRGPAGTGKTVVGLHRAIYLAQRSEHPVLFVSFVKTLPVVLSALARRLSETASERIEFVGVHRLAFGCLELTGEKCHLDPRSAGAAFRAAWRDTDAAATLGSIDERPSYWQEELDHVIKGRGITEFETYRNLLRVGRKTRMRAEDRGYMWDLYVAYEDQLVARGIHDFNDLLIKARQVVERFPDLFRYSTVIVDEVQDLNLVAVEFLRAFAGDGPNGLLMIGDGQQSVYPGGFNLAEAGINVAGRGTVLKHNYRNTVEILEEALRVVGTDSFDDLDGVAQGGARESEASRHGYPPVRAEAATQHDLDAALTRQVEMTQQVLGVPWGDMAILVERRKDVEHYQRLLAGAHIPYVELTQYDGVTSDRVKIGTIKRSKGLEFKFVLLPGLSHDAPPLWPGETTESYAERCERLRRELFVAMTRARDGLWLGYLADRATS